MRSAKELAERQFQQKQEGVKALTDYQVKEQATRLLTAKLRSERLGAKANLTGSAAKIGQIVTHVTSPQYPPG